LGRGKLLLKTLKAVLQATGTNLGASIAVTYTENGNAMELAFLYHLFGRNGATGIPVFATKIYKKMTALPPCLTG